MPTEELTQLLQTLLVKVTQEETQTLFQAVVQWLAILLSALICTYAAERRGISG